MPFSKNIFLRAFFYQAEGIRRGPEEAYEPPPAIQNAMMTKDKKPFTYTPGMGGKLDLSQIRSPRMARRVAKNANDEGVEGPPKSAVVQEPKTPTNNIYSQPQVAVPVFPQQPVGNLRSTLPRSPPGNQLTSTLKLSLVNYLFESIVDLSNRKNRSSIEANDQG